ncbi:MAG: type VI secretion system tip protein VgrG [Xanthomonadaceae bacterium]|jgi:type VI secretion system secreted protein VgrG|nr:type VI secretion system tip protein VgrG [Xanthomonadaceae bacterium]
MTDRYAVLQTTLALFEQNDRLIRLHFPQEDGPAARLVPEQLHATEGLSRDFQFSVTVLANDAALSSQEVIGKMVCIDLVRKDGGLRHFNGYVFEFRRVGTDGGLATYQMLLGPWLAFLKLRKDNYLFHDKTIGDQTAEIFHDCPLSDYEMRIDGADEPLTLATQWQESDYNYLHRRWEERGWHYWYEHRPDGHTLVLSDDSQLAEAIDADANVRYHDGQALEDGDAITEWSPIRRLASTAYTHSSFDFKNPNPQLATLHTLNDQGAVPSLEVYEYAGAYGFKDSQRGDALARLRIEEIESQARQFHAAGDCTRLQPGRWFELTDHGEYLRGTPEDREFLVVEITHQAHNNYRQQGKPALYRNQATCIARKTPWRPGRGMNSTEPKLYGLLTATVVGPANEEIYCDEYGRVRVQFHFDREGRFDQRSSCWIRVASNWAGDRFGFMAIPRIGQEVLVQFLDGNPDKPLITGRVYNQDNMPPWELNDQQALTGIRSKEIAGTGFNHLIMDDTSERIQTQLSTTHQLSQLNLGHIARPPDSEGCKEFRGEGFELRTDAQGAIRANGLYLSTFPRQQAASTQMDAAEARQLLEQATELVKTLSKLAGQHEAEPLTAPESLGAFAKIPATPQGASDTSGRDADKFTENALIGAGESGIALVTPGETHQYSARQHTLTTQDDLNVAAGKSWLASVADKLSFFVRQDIKIFSGKGKIDIQAQDHDIKIIADKVLKLISAQDKIEIAAKKEILLTSGGGYIRLKDGNIYLHAPEAIEHKASLYPFDGPAGMDYRMPRLSKTSGDYNLRFRFMDDDGIPYAHTPYIAHLPDGTAKEGITDQDGYTSTYFSDTQENVAVHLRLE